MLKKIYNIIIVIFPILSAYKGIAGVDLGTIILFICGILCLMSNIGTFRMVLPKGFGLFYIVAMIISIIFTQSFPLRLTLFTANLILACCYIDINKIIVIYSKVVSICCIFFIVQEITYYLTGIRIHGILPFLPTIYDNSDNVSFIYSLDNASRLSSLFLEPSYFAQFIFPYIVYNLFSDDKKKNYKAMFVSLVMIFIRSGNGIILLVIIWFIWLLLSNYKLIYKFGIILLSTLGIFVVIKLDSSIFISLMERSSELLSYKGDEQYMSSGFVRFFRGYYLYGELPVINQLFGTSSADIEQYKNLNIFFLNENDNFLNGVQTLLIHNGIFVLILYIRHLLLLGNNSSDIKSKVFIICILFLMIGESYYLTSRIFFVTVLLFGIYQSQKQKQEYLNL